ncbi:hypothetical protein MSG37_17535 [Shewanella sp. 1CM18E]|uniref:hypothetical protein n=1 Tax=Shewanella sp. 1CM18E TaxID=2929169 RepID=UPI0020C10685|nr:hypothetical protein [Shewanella sp. 1CM18E]MCK8046694.1 hypothetical protein [Shewanella sp. 1CM18E]
MNIYLLIAGLIALATSVWHLTYARKQFLMPMLHADFDATAQVIMRCVFHYVTVFLLLSSFVLLACAFAAIAQMQSYGMLIFIALNFGLFAIWQIYIAFMSDASVSLKRLFQWLLFVLIAGFTAIGALQA